MARSYWLAKSEPDVFSIQDLEKAKGKTTPWDGVRNYQARNFLRAMKKGDLVLFYHSSADPPGAAGIAEVVREAYPEADPTWSAVDVKHVTTFPRVVTLEEMKKEEGLSKMIVLKRGNRLSVTPVTEAELEIVSRLGTAR